MYKKGLIRGYNLHKNFFCNYTANGTTKEGGRCAMVSKLSQLKTIKEELAATSSIWDECSYNSLRSLIGEQDRVDKRKRGIIHPEDNGKLNIYLCLTFITFLLISFVRYILLLYSFIFSPRFTLIFSVVCNVMHAL